MKRRRIAAAVATALTGVTALLLLPFAGGATASSADAASTLSIYSLHGKAGGIDAEFALRPSIFDPLLQAAIGYAASDADSSAGGASSAIASELYPGSLILGGAGCGGVPGTVTAGFPETSCHASSGEGTILDFPSNGTGPVVLKTGHMKAVAELRRSLGTITIEHVTLEPADGVLLTITGLSSTSTGALDTAGAAQITTTVIDGITLAAPGLTIDVDNLVSTARATSDGAAGQAEGSLRFGGVTVTFGGQTHAATIDNDGIHLQRLNGPTPPPQAPLPDDVRQPLEARLQQAIGQAGIEVRTGTPVKIVDGTRAESAVGGLVITLETGRPPYPPVPPPPVPLPQPSNYCLNTGPLKGLCVGPGIVPIPPGDIAPTISIGAVAAQALADPGSVFIPPVFTGGGVVPPPGGTVVGGVTYTPPASGGGIVSPGGSTPASRAPLVGLVSNLPSSALAIAGAVLLVLAVGLAAGPSLRRT